MKLRVSLLGAVDCGRSFEFQPCAKTMGSGCQNWVLKTVCVSDFLGGTSTEGKTKQSPDKAQTEPRQTPDEAETEPRQSPDKARKSPDRTQTEPRQSPYRAQKKPRQSQNKTGEGDLGVDHFTVSWLKMRTLLGPVLATEVWPQSGVHAHVLDSCFICYVLCKRASHRDSCYLHPGARLYHEQCDVYVVSVPSNAIR